MLKKHFQFSKIYFIGLLITFVLFLLSSKQVYTHITLSYAYDPEGDAFAAAYCGEEVLSECEIEEGVAQLYFWGTKFTQIAPIHYDTYEELYLKNIQIRVYGMLVWDLSPEQIPEYFTPNDGIRRLQIEEPGLNIMTANDHPAFVATRELLDKMDKAADVLCLFNFVFFAAIYSMLYWYLFKVLDLVHDHSYENLLDAVLGIVGITAMLLSWSIAFHSAYGGTVHPDEMQTRAAVEYYRTHWIQPDIRSEFIKSTVSGYGMTRLSEINLYYLFAGRLANFCAFEMSFRALGMLMILILLCFVLKNMKKERFMTILFFATPQLWYLFSYATSDAYDYLFAVFAAYEVLSDHSALNRILKEPFEKRQIPAYLGAGFLFGNLLMAKKTFYVVLATIFMLLLYRLLFAQKEERRKLFGKYLALLGIAFMIVLVRYMPDLGYYGLHKGAAVDQVIEETAWTQYKPSTPAIEQAESTLLYEKGVSLKEFFTEWNFNRELFKNYFGYYGIYSLSAKEWYYVLMGALYIALLAVVGILVHKNIKCQMAQGNPVLRIRLTYWTMWGMIALMYLLTVYNAYFVDFQPQGRYLFPALPALACQMTLYKEVEEHRAVRTLLTAIAVVSLYSFYKIAYLNF